MIHLSFLLSLGLPSRAGIRKGVTCLLAAFTQNRQARVVKAQELSIKTEPDYGKPYFYNYSLNSTSGVFKNVEVDPDQFLR